jgi:hypothetical protein
MRRSPNKTRITQKAATPAIAAADTRFTDVVALIELSLARAESRPSREADRR